MFCRNLSYYSQNKKCSFKCGSSLTPRENFWVMKSNALVVTVQADVLEEPWGKWQSSSTSKKVQKEDDPCRTRTDDLRVVPGKWFLESDALPTELMSRFFVQKSAVDLYQYSVIFWEKTRDFLVQTPTSLKHKLSSISGLVHVHITHFSTRIKFTWQFSFHKRRKARRFLQILCIATMMSSGDKHLLNSVNQPRFKYRSVLPGQT